MLRRFTCLSLLLLFTVIPTISSRGDDDKTPPKRDTPKEKTSAKAHELKNYDDVITKTAITSPGVFLVHRLDDKIYFEIPKDAFDRLMLWQAEVVKGPPGVSWGGLALGRNFVRWERRGNKVYLWQATFAKRADGKAIQTAVESANFDTIIAGFNVEAEGKDRSSVINVTSLYLSENADLSVKRAVGGAAGAIDEARSYVDSIKNFPTNVEIRSVLTFRGGAGGAAPALPGRPGAGAGGGAAGRSHSALVHYSLVMLPEKPMQGRFFDPRVGYFTESFENYTEPNRGMQHQQYITRFRLEKKDPTAEVSEPVKPIVFYVSREVPEKWRPYLMKGIEDWKPAFEKAGFKNAIIAKEAPDPREDPTWDPEDARYSVIRWVAEPVANAMGPNVHDPRSGEVISAHIIFWHDILKLTQNWYFVQCSAQDERARKLPLPDEVTGDLLRYVAAHEVGHTLGLRHNHRASSAYTIEQLRDPTFTAKNGTVASIMAYGRFNYVCQPEDKVKQLIPVVAPYDHFAIEWGYKAIPTAKSTSAEKATLDKWASRQLEEPWLRFGGEDGPAQVDPTVKTENIGIDSLKATELGLKNLDHVLDHLQAGTTTQGENFELMEEIYGAILTHRRNWFNAVALNVGGVIESRTLAGRGTESFTRVPKERQKEAVQFLLHHAFTTPTKLINPTIVNRFKYTGVASDVMSQQSSLLRSLLAGNRIRRLQDAEVLLGDKAYNALDLVADVQEGVWSELHSDAVKIDPLRRSLQRTYLEILRSELMPPKTDTTPGLPFSDVGGPSGSTDFKAIGHDALRKLKEQVESAIPRSGDSITRVHLQEAAREINELLTEKK
jgi:hypothetical protein